MTECAAPERSGPATTVLARTELARTGLARTDPVAVKGSPRKGPMPHNGYRPFNIDACNAAFPTFRFTPLMDGLKLVHAQTVGAG